MAHTRLLSIGTITILLIIPVLATAQSSLWSQAGNIWTKDIGAMLCMVVEDGQDVRIIRTVPAISEQPLTDHQYRRAADWKRLLDVAAGERMSPVRVFVQICGDPYEE